MTFTELVNKKIESINIQKLVSESNVQMIGQHISELAQMLVRINQEVARRQAMYNLCLNEFLTGDMKSVSHAKIAAEASPEWAELLNAKALKESVVSLIQALKYTQRSLKDEMDYTR